MRVFKESGSNAHRVVFLSSRITTNDFLPLLPIVIAKALPMSRLCPNRSKEVGSRTHLLRSQTLIAGMDLDLDEVISASEERLFTGPNTIRNAGGKQRIFGLFGEDIVRQDWWSRY